MLLEDGECALEPLHRLEAPLHDLEEITLGELVDFAIGEDTKDVLRIGDRRVSAHHRKRGERVRNQVLLAESYCRAHCVVGDRFRPWQRMSAFGHVQESSNPGHRAGQFSGPVRNVPEIAELAESRLQLVTEVTETRRGRELNVAPCFGCPHRSFTPSGCIFRRAVTLRWYVRRICRERAEHRARRPSSFPAASRGTVPAARDHGIRVALPARG